jgi:predicted dehydrogenase
MRVDPVLVACIGMGWWSDVLADAIQRSGKLKIVSCYTRTEEKRANFAKKYNCKAAPSLEEILSDPSVEGLINTTPNNVHLETCVAAAKAGKHMFVDKPIANTLQDGRAIVRACQEANIVLTVGYQRRRENQFRWIRQKIEEGHFGILSQAEANIARHRMGRFDLTSWRHQASEMPGGVMLQIGLHYVDVLEYLIGPVKTVNGKIQHLAMEGENPDVAALQMEHENGVLSNLLACYCASDELYTFNVYGTDATAYYNLQEGLRYLPRGQTELELIQCKKNDTILEELEEFADSVRGTRKPEMDGEKSLSSLAVIRAGIKSASEGRRVPISEILGATNE